MSSLKTSRWALLSKLSEMAPATVPAASRLACSDDAPQATVALRLTPEIFMIACLCRCRAVFASRAQSRLAEVAGGVKANFDADFFVSFTCHGVTMEYPRSSMLVRGWFVLEPFLL